MRSKIAAILAAASVLAVSHAAYAKHEVDHSFPWVQTQSARGQKAVQREDEHWGKHHHHGIYLEGSDYEHPTARQYD